MMAIRALLIALTLSGCAAFRAAEKRAWEKDGDCAVICDYVQGYMSTAIQTGPNSCHCHTPQLASFNEGRLIALDSPEAEVECKPDCKTEAAKICAYNSWRCPEF